MPVRRVQLGNTGIIVRENIREIRIKRELTQNQLAVLAELPTQSITEIENGARRVNVDDLAAICRALKVAPAEILGMK